VPVGRKITEEDCRQCRSRKYQAYYFSPEQVEAREEEERGRVAHFKANRFRSKKGSIQYAKGKFSAIPETEEASTAEISSVTTMKKDIPTEPIRKRTKKALMKKKPVRQTWPEHKPVFDDEDAWNKLYDQVRNGWIPISDNGRPWKYAAFRTLGSHCKYKYGKPYNTYPPIPTRSYEVSIFKSCIPYKSGHFGAF
jgi:hypothetical protein